MSERKFKIGDRVEHRLYNQGANHGTVKSYEADKIYGVLFDKTPGYLVVNEPVNAYEDYMTLIPKPVFQVGDRVKYVASRTGKFLDNSNNGRTGTVVKVRDDDFTDVEFDNGGYGIGSFTANLELLPKLKPLMLKSDVILDPTTKAPVDSKWETSYTKKIYDAIGRIQSVKLSPEAFDAVYNAYILLAQYHADMAIPYQQRDAARAEAAKLRSEIEQLQKDSEEAETVGARNLIKDATLHAAYSLSRLVAVDTLNVFGVKSVSQLKSRDYKAYIEQLINKAFDKGRQSMKDAVSQVIS